MNSLALLYCCIVEACSSVVNDVVSLDLILSSTVNWEDSYSVNDFLKKKVLKAPGNATYNYTLKEKRPSVQLHDPTSKLRNKAIPHLVQSFPPKTLTPWPPPLCSRHFILHNSSQDITSTATCDTSSHHRDTESHPPPAPPRFPLPRRHRPCPNNQTSAPRPSE